MSMARILAALLMLCCASGPLSAEDMPQLMLEAGGHMNDITGLALTSDGRLLVSAGDDKVIRVWDWEAAKTIRIIRGQIAAGSEGKIFALALSPDGRWLAAGGWMKVPQESGHVIRLYDFATGKLVALLRGHTNVVRSLAFSPDSRLLISGQRGYAILWDVEHQEVIHRLKGQEQIEIDAVAFTPDGQRAITGSDDATLRLWRVSNADLIAEMTGHEAPIGRALAVRSSDGMIASGDETGKIRLWDGKTGEYLRTLANQKGSVGPLSFAPNGMWLLSTTQRGEGGASQWPGHVWDVASGREIVTYTKHDNILFAGAVSPNGRLVATSGGDNNEIHIWDPNTGETRRVLRSVGTGIWAAAFSSDGHRIAWGTTHSRALTMQFRLPTETQGLGKPEPIDKELAKDFLRASTTYNTYTLSTRPGGRPTREKAILDIQKDRRTLVSIERDSTTGMQHLSFSFTPDGKSIVSGGAHGRISAYDLMGKRLGDFVGHESEVWAVTPSPDGRLLLSSSDDQTIRLWNLTTRELIVTFFCSRDREWVMWTPQGYYASSPAGDRLVGWQINKGPDQAADYVTGNQLRTHFYRPDIVDRAIILASANAAVGQARGTDFSLTDLLKRRPPRSTSYPPNTGAAQSRPPSRSG